MSADAATDLPNLPMLIKLLKMTTSSNDAEALLAIRKANEQLKKFGGDWETLLRGKVTIIGDPFEGVKAPRFDDAQVRRTQAPPPSPVAPKPQPAPRTQPRPQPTPSWSRPKPQSKPVFHCLEFGCTNIVSAMNMRCPSCLAKLKPKRKAAAFSNIDRVNMDDIV